MHIIIGYRPLWEGGVSWTRSLPSAASLSEDNSQGHLVAVGLAVGRVSPSFLAGSGGASWPLPHSYIVFRIASPADAITPGMSELLYVSLRWRSRLDTAGTYMCSGPSIQEGGAQTVEALKTPFAWGLRV